MGTNVGVIGPWLIVCNGSGAGDDAAVLPADPACCFRFFPPDEEAALLLVMSTRTATAAGESSRSASMAARRSARNGNNAKRDLGSRKSREYCTSRDALFVDSRHYNQQG
jgi:hypothetical protein